MESRDELFHDVVGVFEPHRHPHQVGPNVPCAALVGGQGGVAVQFGQRNAGLGTTESCSNGGK